MKGAFALYIWFAHQIEDKVEKPTLRELAESILL